MLRLAQELHVDLQDVRLDVLEKAQARVAAAEIIDGDREAVLLEPLDESDGLLRLVHEDRLRDLELEMPRVDLVLLDEMREDLVEVEVVDVLDRDVDRDPVAAEDRVILPRLQQAAGHLPDVVVELPDLAVLLEDRDEYRGRDHAAVLADPARERLRPDHVPVPRPHLRLQVELYLPAAQRIREAAQHRAVAYLVGHHVIRVPDKAVALLRLQDARRQKRAVAEHRDRHAPIRDAADANRDLQVEADGRKPVHDRLDRLEVFLRVKDRLRDHHREAVRADAPVGRARVLPVAALQHAADAHQELIALRHAVEAVQ